MGKRPVIPQHRPHSWVDNIPSYLSLAGVLAALGAFYFNTNYAITDLKTRSDGDVKIREQLRDALTKNAEKTSDAISELSKHAAVQDERTQNISNNLTTIQNQLSTISTALSPAKNPPQR